MRNQRRKSSSKRNMNLSVHRHGPGMTVINSLPKDLLLDVLARVASSSFTDLFHARLSCRDFLESTRDDYIYQRISIDKFPIIHWFPPSQGVLDFLAHCFKKENPESLFRQGMLDYFNLGDVESGLGYLKMAIEKGGHLEAMYVYGMILLSSGEESSHEHGLNLLNMMYSSRSRTWNVGDSRERVKSVLSQMWVNNLFSPRVLNTKCHEQDHVIRFERRGWSLDEDTEILSCKTCLWYRELIYFCRILNIGV